MNIKFTDNSDKILSEMIKAKKNALYAIGTNAEGYAKEETPVDTGRLINSIAHVEDEDATYIGTNVEYAKYVEFGSRTVKAHHMLKKAATEHTAEYKELAKQAFKNT